MRKVKNFQDDAKRKMEETLGSFHVLDLLSHPKDFQNSKKMEGTCAIIDKEPFIISETYTPNFETEIIEEIVQDIQKTWDQYHRNGGHYHRNIHKKRSTITNPSVTYLSRFYRTG